MQMRIYTLAQSNLFTITTEVEEPQYVEGIPYSLQQKCNIPQRITVNNLNGNLSIFCGVKRVISGKEAEKIIKILNGYSKVNNKTLIRK